MKNFTICLIMLSGLIFFKPLNAVAQYPLYVHFHLTAIMQEPTIGIGGPEQFQEKIVRIDNAKLLELLGAATTNDFTGADLVANTLTSGFSVVKGTNVLADVALCFCGMGLAASWCAEVSLVMCQ